MDNFGPKPIGLTPLEKCQYFDFLKFLFFYNLESRFFVLEYHRTHFPGLYCLKKYGGEMDNFGPKPIGLNPLEKCQYFDFLKFLFFL